MEKWILVINLGGLTHVVDVMDSEKDCAELRGQMIVEWERTKRTQTTVIGYCSPYSEFVLVFNKRNTYTLR